MTEKSKIDIIGAICETHKVAMEYFSNPIHKKHLRDDRTITEIDDHTGQQKRELSKMALLKYKGRYYCITASIAIEAKHVHPKDLEGTANVVNDLNEFGELKFDDH